MYLLECVVFLIVFDYMSAESEVITEVSFNISIENDIPTCNHNPVRGLVAQQRFRVSAASNDKEFAAKLATVPMPYTSTASRTRTFTSLFWNNEVVCSFSNTKQNSIRLKLEDNKHLFVTSDELYFKPEMDGQQLICKLGINMSQNPHNNNSLTLHAHGESSPATCVMDIHLEVTKVSFNISMEGNIPKCTENLVSGPIIAEQKFQVSATTKDKLFAYNTTTCYFKKTPQNPIHLELKDENNQFVESDELYFKPEMDGHQLVCELGLQIERNGEINNSETLDDRRNSTATCVKSIQLGTGGSIEKNQIDYKMLMIMGFSLASLFLIISLAQSVALWICVPKGRFRTKKEERTNTDSIISDSGTIYEELKPVPKDIETVIVDESNKQPGKNLTIDPLRPEKNGKKGIKAIFARSPKSHPPPIAESTLPDPPRPESNGKKGILARFAKSPKSHHPPVTESALPDPSRSENNIKKGTTPRSSKASPEHHPSLANNSTLNLSGVNASSARPHVLQEEIYSNEYVPEPTSVVIKPPPRPPKPNNRLKPPVAKKLIRQPTLDGNIPSPVKSSKRISDMVSKLEGHLPPALGPKVPVTSVLKLKNKVVTSEQHVPAQHHAWSPPPRTPVIPTQHHLEDERMDSEDSEDWTYEDLEEIYEMPEP